MTKGLAWALSEGRGGGSVSSVSEGDDAVLAGLWTPAPPFLRHPPCTSVRPGVLDLLHKHLVDHPLA